MEELENYPHWPLLEATQAVVGRWKQDLEEEMLVGGSPPTPAMFYSSSQQVSGKGQEEMEAQVQSAEVVFAASAESSW